MANREWLYCDDINWSDMINIIKLEKNPTERLREFHDLIKRDEMSVEDVIDEWGTIDKSEIKDYLHNCLYGGDLEDAAVLGSLIYWFFNIYTGEAFHIKCSVKVSYSDVIID